MTSMEESWTDWLCDMELEDCSFTNQSETNMDKGSSQSQDVVANSSVADESSLEIRPFKLLKTSNSSSSSSPSSYILSFDNTNPPPLKVDAAMKQKNKVVNPKITSEPRRAVQEGKKNARSRYHTPDHIIAERMRREKISKQFIALSALIPDLKKMDKASVLGNAINYLKQLKEQVKVLEEEQGMKIKSVEPIVVVEKPQSTSAEDEDIVSDTSSNSFHGNSDTDPSARGNMSFPEVEVRVSEKKVLIRILCEKEKAVLANIFKEIEKLHLSVINSSFNSFGSSFVVITTIAEMGDEFDMSSVKELAKSLSVGLI